MTARSEHVARLGDLTMLISSGSTPKGGSEIYLREGPVMLIRSQNVRMNELTLDDVAYVTHEIDAGMNRSRVRHGDVLLNITGASIGRVAAFELEGIRANVNQHVCIIRPKPDALFTRYVTHLISSREFQAEIDRLQHGGTRQALTFRQIAEFKIPLPPLAEQRRIAEVLDRAEALRARRRAALGQLDSLTQSLFLDLFGDPVSNPKGWPKSDLGNVVKVVGGYAFKSEDFAADGNPVVRISNLTGDNIDFTEIARIPEEKLGKGGGFKIQLGDILIAMSGATTGKLGVVPLELSEDLYQNQRVGNYRISDASKIHRDYLLGILRSRFYQRFLWQLAAGVAQPNVSGWQLESAIVPLPPIDLQREFAHRVRAVEKLKTAQRASLGELDALFASLQHRAFRGEL